MKVGKRKRSVATTSHFITTRDLAAKEPDFFSAQITEGRRFYLDLSPPKSQAFSVICGGREHCAANYHTQRKDFRYFAVEFVAEGQGTLVLGGQAHRLTTGAVFAYGPGVSHDIESDAERPLVKYFVSFVGKKARESLVAPGPEAGEIVQTSAPGQIREIFDELVAAGSRQTPFRQRLCGAIVEQLLLRIAETAVPLGSIGTEAFETYERCRLFIESNYLRLRELGEIAGHCDVHPSYVCRLFKRFGHQGPWGYVMHLRMREAADRLCQPGALVKTVARSLGFADPFQFSRTFRQVIGLSPRQFMQLRGKYE